MPPPKPAAPCHTPECRRPADSRGLCQRCYTRVASQIRRGQYPGWDAAEQAGLCRPLQERPQPTPPAAVKDPEPYENKWDQATDEMTAEELDAFIAARRPTMPRWRPGDE